MRLVEELQARGLRAWVDLEDIPPSAEWMSEIQAAIEAADGYLVLRVPTQPAPPSVPRSPGPRCGFGQADRPGAGAHDRSGVGPPSLAARNWIDATTGVPQAVDQVIVALRTDLDQPQGPHPPRGVSRRVGA